MYINNKLSIIGLFFIISASDIEATTLVYNMRIRRAFNVNLPEIFGGGKKRLLLATVLPIFYQRNRHIIEEEFRTNLHESRLMGGTLFNIRFMPSKKWWLELTTGIERESTHVHGTRTFSDARTGFDDIVLAAGYNIIRNHSQFVLFGITGFPTHTKVTLNEAQDTLVGTRFFSAGVGSEFSQSFINTLKNTVVLIFQNRFLHFFNRSWQPILPEGGKIQPGNVIDLLFGIRYRHKKNTFETGYNATFFTNQAILLTDRTIPGKSFTRHSGYASYTRLMEKLPVIKRPGAVGAGFLVSRADRFKTKIFSCWLNVSAIF